MLRLIMGNRWLAALWALLALVSVSEFASKDGGELQTLDTLANQIRAKHDGTGSGQSVQTPVEDNSSHDSDGDAAAFVAPQRGHHNIEGPDPS